jgi:hypothetical protein
VQQQPVHAFDQQHQHSSATCISAVFRPAISLAGNAWVSGQPLNVQGQALEATSSGF